VVEERYTKCTTINIQHFKPIATVDSMPRFDSFSKRHPALTLTLLNVILLLVIAIIFELVLRFYFVEYTNDFYSGTKKEGVVEYPYGKIIINSYEKLFPGRPRNIPLSQDELTTLMTEASNKL
jgi:hypothetical protein